MNVEQVKVRIAAATRDADAAASLLAKVCDTIDDALGAARHTTHDSRHPKVVAALAELDRAHRDAERIAALLDTAVRAAQAYVRRIG